MGTKKEKLRNQAILNEDVIELNSGALSVSTGEFTGRSPNAKRIVVDSHTRDSVDWKNTIPMTEEEWSSFKEDYFEYSSQINLYERTLFAGHKDFSGLTIKTHTELAWHSLFAENMFSSEVSDSAEIFNLYYIPSYSEDPHVIINFTEKMILISGTRYAGEMKKSVFTVLNHILPESEVFPMHCSVNLDEDSRNPTIFFGLSGTGKTTLSADKQRKLVGDDEHGWSKSGLFNFENGCYAKVINLDREQEPDIFEASTKRDSILENVIIKDGMPDFHDNSLTENTRCSYPLSYINNSVDTRSTFNQPKNVVFLTCDAFGILPAVAKLSPAEAWKFFMIGYTSKVAGTERGIDKPVATFSPCFGAPFMTRKPAVYADMLKNFLEESGATCWMLNTGWTDGPYGIGERISIDDTRVILSKIYSGELESMKTFEHDYTGLNVPLVIDVNLTLIKPELGWLNVNDYQKNCNFLLDEMRRIVASD